MPFKRSGMQFGEPLMDASHFGRSGSDERKGEVRSELVWCTVHRSVRGQLGPNLRK